MFIPNRYWDVNRVLRAVWVGYHNRPGLIAWRGRINWFLPFVLRTFWQIFVILDCALGTWRFTLVNRNLISFWRVGVRLIWLNIVGYRHRFGFRSIAVNHLRLAGLTVANFTGIRCFRPDYLGAIWQFNLAAILVLDYNGTWVQFIANRHGLTVLQVHRCSSFSRVLFGIGLLDH